MPSSSPLSRVNIDAINDTHQKIVLSTNIYFFESKKKCGIRNFSFKKIKPSDLSVVVSFAVFSIQLLDDDSNSNVVLFAFQDTKYARFELVLKNIENQVKFLYYFFLLGVGLEIVFRCRLITACAHVSHSMGSILVMRTVQFVLLLLLLDVPLLLPSLARLCCSLSFQMLYFRSLDK